MKKILNALKTFWQKMPKWLLAIIISVAAGLIFKSVTVGVFTLIGIVAALTIYIFARQFWWFLTSTGDSAGRGRIIKIKKGHHYPFPGFSIPWLKHVHKNKVTKMSKIFIFRPTCLYNLGDEDQLDWNKLFGFSIGYHHINSFRFGWRPNLDTGKIEIGAYEYQDTNRTSGLIAELDINIPYCFGITYAPEGFTKYVITNKQTNEVKIHTTKHYQIKKFGWGYKLGLYFGGNEKAPQTIEVFKVAKPVIKT